MSDDNQLTPEEQAALDAQRNAAPEPAEEPAAAAPQEGAEAPEGEAAGQAQPEPDKRPQMVPHAALHEERERRKQAEARAAETERRSEERMRMLLEKLGPQPDTTPAPQIPAVDQDPVGHIVGNIADIRGQVQNLAQATAAQQEQAQRAQAVQALQQQALAMEVDYRRDNQEYEPAVNFLANLRNQQLMAAGVVNPAERQAIINQEAMAIAWRAMQSQQNPAEVLHAIAKASGFAAAPPAANGGGQAPAASDPSQKLDAIERGQQAARSLSNVRGSGPSPITATKLQEMSNDDFLKMMEKPPAEVRRLMGMN